MQTGKIQKLTDLHQKGSSEHNTVSHSVSEYVSVAPVMDSVLNVRNLARKATVSITQSVE